MRVRLTAKFDWKVPGKRAVIAFRPGDHTVKREVGEAMVAAGVAMEIVAPRREHDDSRRPLP